MTFLKVIHFSFLSVKSSAKSTVIQKESQSQPTLTPKIELHQSETKFEENIKEENLIKIQLKIENDEKAFANSIISEKIGPVTEYLYNCEGKEYDLRPRDVNLNYKE